MVVGALALTHNGGENRGRAERKGLPAFEFLRPDFPWPVAGIRTLTSFYH